MKYNDLDLFVTMFGNQIVLTKELKDGSLADNPYINMTEKCISVVATLMRETTGKVYVFGDSGALAWLDSEDYIAFKEFLKLKADSKIEEETE